METIRVTRIIFKVIVSSVFMVLIPYAAIQSYAAEVEISDIYVDQTFDSSLWAIKGTVRNLGSRPIKGYVMIKFVNAKGQIFTAATAAVNDTKPLGPDQIGKFLYPAFRRYFSRAVGFRVNFVEVEIKLPQEPLSPISR